VSGVADLVLTGGTVLVGEPGFGRLVTREAVASPVPA